MRKIELPTVTIDGEDYPIYCDLYVLQKIQERMDLNDFERGILGLSIVRDDNGDPVHDDEGKIVLNNGRYDINALIMGLTLMINEGLLIESEQEETKYEPVDEKYIGRVCDIAQVRLSNIVHEAFGRCFAGKKKEKRKAGSRRRSTLKSTLRGST